MKKSLLVILFAVLLCVDVHAYGDEDGGAAAQINLQKKKKSNNHFDQPVPDVEPTVYYDNDEREITIIGTGFASYYDVVISSVTTSTVYIFTCVNGTYDTIDVSSLPNDNYVITLDPPVNVSLEGYFILAVICLLASSSQMSAQLIK